MSTYLDTQKFISIPEAAKRFGVGDWSIRRALHDGLIPGVRRGRKLLFVDADACAKFFSGTVYPR